MSDEVKLLPCPFCGCEKVWPMSDNGEFWVDCDKCESRGAVKDDRASAIAAWNTRAIEATRPTDTTDFER